MSINRKLTGVVLATAAAAFFADGAMANGGMSVAEAKVKCSGVNSCKGTSECATATSSCKGLNSCAGQGWVYTGSTDECTSQGGEVLEG